MLWVIDDSDPPYLPNKSSPLKETTFFLHLPWISQVLSGLCEGISPKIWLLKSYRTSIGSVPCLHGDSGWFTLWVKLSTYLNIPKLKMPCNGAFLNHPNGMEQPPNFNMGSIKQLTCAAYFIHFFRFDITPNGGERVWTPLQKVEKVPWKLGVIV